MTDEENEWCRKLKEASKLECEEDYNLYMQAAGRLRLSDDPEVLRKMLACFSDVEAGELQYVLVGACETFPDETFVHIVISEGPEFERKSPFWFNHVVHIILNTGFCVDVLFSSYATLSTETRRWVLGTVEGRLAEEREKYATIYRRLRANEECMSGQFRAN